MKLRNPRGLVILGAALLTGLIAARVASVWMQSRVSSLVASRMGDTRAQAHVVVASRDLPTSARILPDDVIRIRVPEETVPPGAFSSAQDAVGRVTRGRVYRGQAVLEPMLTPRGTKGGLQAVIPDGLRAMTIKVDEVIGIAGFVLPGARVDVVAVIRQQRHRNDPSVSKVVLQNISVLAIDQVVETTEEKPKPSSAVTLLVTPAEAEKLALAVNEGEIQLVMRSFTDQELVSTPGIDPASILHRPPTGVPVVNTQVEVIQRDKRSRTAVSAVGTPRPAPTPQTQVIVNGRTP